MKVTELQNSFFQGKIEKRLYWRLMRENATHILPEIQALLRNNKDCSKIEITKDGVILEKNSGLKMYFNFTDSISRAEADLLNGEDSELYDICAISDILDQNDCQVVLDIGANIGMFSLELYQKHKEMKYYLFEPVPPTFEKMLKTLELNSVDNNAFFPVNSGLSNEIGSFDFYIPGACEAASLQPIDDPFYVEKCDEYGNYIGSTKQDILKCQIDTIDNFVEKNGIQKVDFIKIDVEGNEKNVVLGGVETIKRFHPVIYAELLRKHAKRFGYHPNEVVEFMIKNGYECFTVQKGVLNKIQKIDENTVETNFIFK